MGVILSHLLILPIIPVFHNFMVHRKSVRRYFCRDMGPVDFIGIYCYQTDKKRFKPRKTIDMENIVMFVVGVIVFTLYIVGYLFMVKRQNELQQKEILNPKSTVRKSILSDTDGYTINGSISRVKSKKGNSKTVKQL